MFKTALALAKLSLEKRKKNHIALNFIFTGNPGSGKTTVARLFASILHDSGMRKASTCVELTAQGAKDEGIDEFRKALKQAENGVLFLDEAPDLDPSGDFKGKPIVNELLTTSENKRDSISIILAGYEDEMHSKLFSFNEGLKSRFQQVQFEDYDEKELCAIFHKMVSDRGWECPEEAGIITAKRLAKQRSSKGFGNARAVRQVVERACQRAMSKGISDENLVLTLEDVIGENPLYNPKVAQVRQKFDSKIGWDSIKKSVQDLVELCGKNYQLELDGKPPYPVFLNRMFLGNPGTGKTTCAELYGELLKHLNFLSIGDVVKKVASDFIGDVVGASTKKTATILSSAKGKCLIIDEAYNLDNSLYGKQVLDVLVEKVQNSETDDLCVLLLGYEQPMLEMLRKQNPGLARRFPREHAFCFEDYGDRALLSILNGSASQSNVTIPSEVSERFLQALAMQRSMANFGNAGAVNTMLQTAIAKAVARDDLEYDESGKMVLAVADLGLPDADNEDPLAPLENLYRMEEVKKSLQNLRNAVLVAQREGTRIPEVGHFVFRGSPGTGKTTVARVMANILCKFGLIATDRLVETSGLDMTGQYVGQTKTKVTEMMNAARGSVLFIDEAYELGIGPFGQEAMTTLLAGMTDPTYKGTIFVVAGYPRDMDQMLDRNAGLKSRFTHFLDFPDWDGDDCIRFLRNVLEQESFVVKDLRVWQAAKSGFDELIAYRGWGNGRDVAKVWKEIKGFRSNRIVDLPPEEEPTIHLADVIGAIKQIVTDRKPPVGPSGRAFDPPANKNLPMQTQEQRKEDHKVEVKVEEVEEKQDVEQREEKQHDGRDPGVSDHDWAELEIAKKEHAERLERLKKERLDAELQEELKRQQKMQERLRQLMNCPAGFQWFQTGGGWRCGGGSHYVSNDVLEKHFMRDV
ncbi:P-loop containing nucleoside triphosphate hydrolase protein [Gonapodya prolifera JEL478]|uniref:p-loop containing nucleoside triphosphate hydrolase protein n=1 Tax=Gonapodya prolifera (strain JEL478) TaxID=1344416 RepID=A0A139AZ20_GONPJ|nr:P-loop containing nucleoside triphosphate hydrolase protein [Gonapodya prolifera JEL478]|eukprot:KXS21803.1 P-loop containing nucleoside triphosphate hydrolase protein [Gonapodya prolifera JEL478]